jgi:glycosyltransferase involved in cell wall biosynthesis
MKPKVSILIPHFQTPELTLLCLRLIRRHTHSPILETIVIDNGSTDGSGERLRHVRWARVIRRDPPAGERPARSHGLALNLGLEHASAPLVLTMHTDTMVLRPDWLEFLVGTMERVGPRCGAVGSWKMESTPWLRRIGKRCEHWLRRQLGRSVEGRKYIRSHCALYRRDAIDVWPAKFDPSDHRSAGEELHDGMERAGFICHFLTPEALSRHVRHLNHATMALNAEFGKSDPYMSRTRKRAIRRINEFFRSIAADRILADHSLDG